MFINIVSYTDTDLFTIIFLVLFTILREVVIQLRNHNGWVWRYMMRTENIRMLICFGIELPYRATGTTAYTSFHTVTKYDYYYCKCEVFLLKVIDKAVQ